jgi:hypothetical protein
MALLAIDGLEFPMNSFIHMQYALFQITQKVKPTTQEAEIRRIMV